MRLYISGLIYLLVLCGFNGQAQDFNHISLENKTYVNDIHSVVLSLTGNQLSKPVIRLNTDDRLHLEFDDLSNRFRELGLYDSLVRPSYVVNCGNLQTKIAARIKNEPELNYNKDNAAYLRNLVSEMSLLAEDTNE